ncbi:MAG: hypothetical protein WC390_06550 [Sulfurimonas sp.]|jgi:hypothetical protein
MTKLSETQKQEVIKLYTTTNLRNCDISKQFGISKAGLIYILKSRGIARRPKHKGNKYNFNEHFFDWIDTEEKAYFLGFLYADGCYYPPHNKIAIELAQYDVDILEKFKKIIDSDYPLYKCSKKTPNGQINEYYQFYLCNEYFSKRCCELGIVPRKSLILTFPTQEQVPEHLLSHFIRGYYDGDGGMFINDKMKKRVVSMKIIGTTTFIQEMYNILQKNVITKITHYIFPYKPTPGLSNYCSTSALSIKLILDWLYKDATIYLDRKYNLYQKLCNNCKDYQRQSFAGSRFFGVRKLKDRFQSYVWWEGKSKYLGIFDTEIEAAQTYDKFCRKNNHNLHKLNFD